MREMETVAKLVASFWHTKQVRKYTGEPYINHPAEVVELVRSVPHTEAMLCAAWLHDVVEDTPATLRSIEYLFGDLTFGGQVALLVEKTGSAQSGKRSTGSIPPKRARKRRPLSWQT